MIKIYEKRINSYKTICIWRNVSKLVITSLFIAFLLITAFTGCNNANRTNAGITLPSDLASFKAIDTNNVWVWQCESFSPSGLKLFKTGNGGKSWTKVTIPVELFPKTSSRGEGLLPAFYFLNTKTIYIMEIEGAKLIVLKTNDGGNHWDRYTSKVAEYAHFVSTVHFVNPDKGYIIALSEGGAGQQTKYLYSTSDGGKTWSKLKVTDSISPDSPSGLSPVEGPITMNFIDSNRGIILISSILSPEITMYSTTNSGKSFEKKILPVPPQYEKYCVTFLSQPVFSNNQGIFVSLFYRNNDIKEISQPVIYKSTDYGNIWIPFVVKGFNGASVNIKGLPMFFLDANYGWTILHSNLYVTKDGGKVWSKIHSGALSNAIKDYPLIVTSEFVTSENGWILLKSKDYKSAELLKTDDNGIHWDVTGK